MSEWDRLSVHETPSPVSDTKILNNCDTFYNSDPYTPSVPERQTEHLLKRNEDSMYFGVYVVKSSINDVIY